MLLYQNVTILTLMYNYSDNVEEDVVLIHQAKREYRNRRDT